MVQRFIRTISRIFKSKGNYDENILIIGAGDAGRILAREIKKKKSLKFNIVGFLDDDGNKQGRFLFGKKIIGSIDLCLDVVKRENVSVIYIALPSISDIRIKEIVNMCASTGCNIRVLPHYYCNTLEPSMLVGAKEIEIGDLLGRDEVYLEVDHINKYIRGKKILVTGGGGSIGSEIVRQLLNFHPLKIVIFEIYENNAYELLMDIKDKFMTVDDFDTEIEVVIGSVRDINRLDEMFSKLRPDVVFHAAAHKHVPILEDSPKEAVKNNVLGTYNTVLVSEKYNVERFVLLSTDKAVNPTNIMGATKRYTEKIISAYRDSNTVFTCVRFGNVLGSNGSVIPLFKKQIKHMGPVTVTHPEITRFFMTIPEAAQLVLQSGSYARGGEVFVLDMGESIKIVDLAEKMIRLSGYKPYVDIPIIFTGLRPGEKLYEELLMDEEGLVKTANDKIFIGTIEDFTKTQLLTEIVKMRKDIKELSDEEFKKNFVNYVSTYQYKGDV